MHARLGDVLASARRMFPPTTGEGRISYYADELPEPHPLPGLRAPRPHGHPVAYVLDDGARRWLVYEARISR